MLRKFQGANRNATCYSESVPARRTHLSNFTEPTSAPNVAASGTALDTRCRSRSCLYHTWRRSASTVMRGNYECILGASLRAPMQALPVQDIYYMIDLFCFNTRAVFK